MAVNTKPQSDLSLIVGDDIIKRKLIKYGKDSNLKNSSYDLTVGEIFPVGRDGYEEKKSEILVTAQVVHLAF